MIPFNHRPPNLEFYGGGGGGGSTPVSFRANSSTPTASIGQPTVPVGPISDAGLNQVLQNLTVPGMPMGFNFQPGWQNSIPSGSTPNVANVPNAMNNINGAFNPLDWNSAPGTGPAGSGPMASGAPSLQGSPNSYGWLITPPTGHHAGDGTQAMPQGPGYWFNDTTGYQVGSSKPFDYSTMATVPQSSQPIPGSGGGWGPPQGGVPTNYTVTDMRQGGQSYSPIPDYNGYVYPGAGGGGGK